MHKTTSFAVLLISTFALPTHGQTPQFQTDAANLAVKEYLRTVEDARRTCLAKLATAEKEALQNGHREDAVKIQAAEAAIDARRAADVFDPFAALEQQVAGTKWANADNARLWSAFDDDHSLRNSKGAAGKWAVVADNTVASTTGVKYVYLWIFDKDGRSVTLQRFNHDKSHVRSYVKQ